MYILVYESTRVKVEDKLLCSKSIQNLILILSWSYKKWKKIHIMFLWSVYKSNQENIPLIQNFSTHTVCVCFKRFVYIQSVKFQQMFPLVTEAKIFLIKKTGD